MTTRRSLRSTGVHPYLDWGLGTILSLVTGSLIWKFIATTSMPLTPLVWRPVAVAVITAIVIELVLIGLLVFRVRTRTSAFYWILALSITNAAWLLVTLMVMLSPTPEAAAFWDGVLPLPAFMIPATLFYFVLSYIDEGLPRSNVLRLLPMATAIIMIYISGASNLIESHVPLGMRLEYWGYQSEPGEFEAIVFFGWSVVLALTSLGLIMRSHLSTHNPIRRRQTGVFMVALLVYIGIGLGVDFGVFFINPHILPPLSFVYTTLLSLIIIVGILKFGLLQVNAASQSGIILENSSEAVVGVNMTARIEFNNSAAGILFGHDKQNLAGRSVLNFLTPQAALVLQTVLRGEGKTPQIIEDMPVTRRGERFTYATVSISQVKDGPHIVGAVLVLQNQTELHRKALELEHEKASVERKVVERTRQLRDEQAKLLASIGTLKQGFLLVGPDGEILIQNQAIQTILNLDDKLASLHDLAGKFVKFNLSSQCQKSYDESRAIETNDVAMGGKILRVFTSPVSSQDLDGEATHVIGIVVLVEDFTEAKVLERSRDEFFSIASHELRTPLTAIRGNTSMLLSMYPEIRSKGPREMVTDIHDSSVRLIAIVNDFLDMSRLEQGKMTFDRKPIGLERIIESVAYEMKAVIREKHLSFEVDSLVLDRLPLVVADPNRVKQILYNLIGNAVIYTQEGGVTVTADFTDKNVTIRVADTGRGIPLDEQKYLFHKFQQASDSILTRDSTRGTGLGLYISRLMASKMGGTLKLEKTNVGKGSVFSLSLPRYQDVEKQDGPVVDG